MFFMLTVVLCSENQGFDSLGWSMALLHEHVCNISSDSRHTDSWEVQFINIFTNHKYEQLRRTMISNVITFINIKSSLRQSHERRRLQSSVYGVF